jgi:triacylglycerol lipase
VTPAPTSENILSGLPSSLTTLLLSLLDSPAYANLTTTFLNDHFNPSTPDVPGVRYFSVAARTERMSPFHPLWLPKLILDETDAIEKSQKGITEFAEEERGNDGLVSVRSAKWGEFLGIIEGCDHWEMRGARGFGSSWDAFGSKGGWGWSEYLGRNKDRGDEGRLKLDTVSSGTQEASAIPQVSKPESGSSSSPSTLERLRLTAAVDWITDHVPIALGTGSPVKETSGETVRKRRDVETSMKFDLERFYVALSRKLYDEGL